MSEVNEHVGRMRELAAAFVPGYEGAAKCMLAAADEIERLAARVAELERDSQRHGLMHLADNLSIVRQQRPWLPIESAPRDGTRVELWYVGKARYGSYNEHTKKWLTDSHDYYQKLPTHWRPEPAGPTSKGEI